MKTYVLMISRYFPATFPREGRTQFPSKILRGEKIHTIRGNYEFWENRIKEVQKGNAELSLRYWMHKPYRSKQHEFYRLGKDDGVGIQKNFFAIDSLEFPRIIKANNQILAVMPKVLAENDSLSLKDFKAWFKGYDLSQPMAIIHFTNFRY